MSLIKVVINNKSNVRSLVRERYRELFQGWRRENPSSRAYTLTRMNSNIRNVLSVDGKEFEEHQFKRANITRWSGRNVLPFAHWYFLVRFQEDLYGNKYAIIEDACYEGDYHNDSMNTKPYGESKLHKAQLFLENKDRNTLKHTTRTNKKVVRLTESQFKQMLVECITKIIKEITLQEW